MPWMMADHRYVCAFNGAYNTLLLKYTVYIYIFTHFYKNTFLYFNNVVASKKIGRKQKEDSKPLK